MTEFKLLRGGIHDKFLSLRTKIQLFSGGFGSGKTSAAVIKALQLADQYPGMNCLMARATFPKLNDTLRKEFIKWCPQDIIQSFPMAVGSSNTCTLKNGSQFVFRYIAQQGKQAEGSTSNQLSATYDLIVVDQMEDPEISYKDLLDLLGRLRGQTMYRGTDPSMPRSGPRWIILTVNPSRNWVWTQLVEPYFQYVGNEQEGIKGGRITDKLWCIRDPNTREPILNPDGSLQLLLELVEGSTYENKHALPKDFIQGLESGYTGQMRDRFLLGKWSAYEGLVYPQFDEQVHCFDVSVIRKYLEKIRKDYDVEWVEGYDFGLASPSCYLLAFTDANGNVFVCDGFYKKEYRLDDQFEHIKRIRNHWGVDDNIIDADPDIFRRRSTNQVGSTVSDLFWSEGGLSVRRADNSVIHGITKVNGYLNTKVGWKNPVTLDSPSPSIYFSLDLKFIRDEIYTYMWEKDSTTEQRGDKPVKSNDHALDTIKYMLTTRPDASKLRESTGRGVPLYMMWHERNTSDFKSRRHG